MEKSSWALKPNNDRLGYSTKASMARAGLAAFAYSTADYLYLRRGSHRLTDLDWEIPGLTTAIFLGYGVYVDTRGWGPPPRERQYQELLGSSVSPRLRDIFSNQKTGSFRDQKSSPTVSDHPYSMDSPPNIRESLLDISDTQSASCNFIAAPSFVIG